MRSRTTMVGLAVVLAALASGALAANAESPASPAAAPSGTGAAAPSPAAAESSPPAAAASHVGPSVPVPSDAPLLASDVPAGERSPLPSSAEWTAAKAVKLTRRGPRATSCGATRVREWLRVRCLSTTFAISLLSGSNEALSFWIGGEPEGRFGEVQLPLRRGDRRVVQLWATGADSAGARVVQPSIVLQELWPEGDPAPTVTVL